MFFVWLVLIGLLNVPFNGYGMNENWQRSEAVSQFQTAVKNKDNREKFVPILLEHNKKLKKQYKRDRAWGVAGMAASVIGTVVLSAALLNTNSISDDTQKVLFFGLGCMYVGTLIRARDYFYRSHDNLQYSKKSKERLNKSEKTSTDWRCIKHMGRYYLETTAINKTYVNSKNTLQKSDGIELHNSSAKETVCWNLNDEAFFKKVLSGTYNNKSWELRKKTEEL